MKEMNTDPIIPFTFVEVDESMYNMTLERIKQLVEENARLKSDVEALDTLVSKLDDDLGRVEGDRNILAKEVLAWRAWCAAEEETVITEPLLWQEVINRAASTDSNSILERTKEIQ